MRDAVVPSFALVGIAYVLIGVVHLHTDPHPAVIGRVAAASGAVFLVVAAALRGWPVGAVAAQVLVAALTVVVLANEALFLGVTAKPQHAYGLYLVALALGLLAFRSASCFALMAACVAVWAFGVYASGAPLAAWSEPAIALASVLALASVVRVFRSRYLARLDALQAKARQGLAARDRALERFRYMTEHATDLIAELDDRGRVLYANPAHESVLGRRPEELVGRFVGDFLVQDLEAGDFEALGDALDAGTSVGRVFEMVASDGTPRAVEAHVRSHRLASGERRILTISRDVTRRAAEERALEQYRASLEEKIEERTAELATSLRELQRSERLASIGTLAAGIAHQVNNPLAAILASAQYALASTSGMDATDGKDVYVKALRDVADEAHRCARIVRSMLQFARNERTEKAPEDVVALAARVCRQCEGYAMSRSGSIELSVAGGSERTPVTVIAGAFELEQALLNVVRNAIESRERGVHVRVTVAPIGDLVRIAVSDDGPGIDDGALAHVFDPFFTTRLREGGTGLGLSIAHGVALDHGGDLRVESEAGKGSRFLLELPLASGLAGDRQP
ncbi:MAG: ATP-binding protein [Myxococcota bacterium]